MNRISVNYEWLNSEPTILINDEPLDVLNESLSVLRRDFYLYAPSFFKILDNYFSAEYKVDFKGTAYQCNCLKELSFNAQYCSGITCTELTLMIPYYEIFEEVSRLNGKYSLDETAEPVIIKNQTDVSLQSNSVFTVVGDTEEEKVLICSSDNVPANTNADLLICPSEKYGVYRANDKYMLTMPAEEITEFLEYYGLFSIVMPFTGHVIRKASRASLDSTDMIALTAIHKQMPQYCLNLPEKVDVGKTDSFTFFVYPESRASHFSVVTDDPDKVVLKDSCIQCYNAGTYKISVQTDKGVVLETRTVAAVEHCLAQSIRLLPQFAFILENATGKINAYVTPDYAENANQVTWTSSNPDVAYVSQEGQVTAFKRGYTVITARVGEAFAELNVIVKKALSGYSISQTSAQIKYKDKLTLRCVPNPTDADIDSVVWKISDPNAGKLETLDNGFTCVYTPNKEVSSFCNIECCLNGAIKGQSCAVSVEGPKSHTALFIFTILTSILSWALCLLFELAFELGGGGPKGWGFFVMLVPLVLSFIGMFTPKKGKFITFFVINVVVTLFWLATGN